MSSKTAGAVISLEEAIALTSSYRAQFPGETQAYEINAKLVRQVLDQPGCVNIRIYNGYDTVSKEICPVIVGVTENGTDMTEGDILDKMYRNPPYGDLSSVLRG